MLKNLKEFKLPEIEEQVLKFWKEHSIFEQSLAKNKGKNKFVFFEGPPTANGMPGLHHLLARSFKDIIPRFKSMQGYDVPRKGGWDTHGLPVELQAEKELGFTGKQDIEKYGIAKFNEKCRELVWRYRKEFESTTTDRLGFWLDIKNPYVTYDNKYIESLWWIIAQMDKKKLLYQGHKIVPWCTRCGTALSSHELAQGYKEVEDTSVYVKFRLIGSKNRFILSWTTTPWSLPGDVALAVGERIEYVEMQVGNESYLIARDRISAVLLDTPYVELRSFKGKDLVGLEYEPLFKVRPLKTKTAYKIYAANFVTTTDGTGVVHTAVMYGEDDYALGVKIGLPQHHTVNEQGHFIKEVKELAGLYARSGKAEALIIDHLKNTGTLLKTEKYKHEYPHCWRCGTALLYYARTSWFVAMSKLRKELIANNKKINWIPEHIKDGRFGEWLREVKDWNFSRERYWGTPLPVWRSKDGKQQIVVSSLADFKKYGNLQGNRFFGMRHGEATHNMEQKNGGGAESATLRSELTTIGATRVHGAAKLMKMQKPKIDLIVASPYYRIQQTAKIIADELKLKIVTDKRLGELNCGIFNWQSMSAYHAWFTGGKIERWTRAPEKAETLSDARARVVEAIRDINKKYKNKNILIVSHGDPLWLLEGAMRGQSDKEFFDRTFYPGYAEPFEIDPPVLPFDDSGRLDMHRPYVDNVVLRDPKTKPRRPQGRGSDLASRASEKGTLLYRVPEVVDGWFDSGSMPYASHHFPFSEFTKQPTNQLTNQQLSEAFRKLDYPADYIAEGIDQTRGWFYTLLAVATALGLPAPYKNVICLGLIHDKNGLKMSKSKGNIVDPLALMQKHGADVLRWYFYTANDPGDSKNFDEQDLVKVMRRFFMIVYNSFVFWNSYAKEGQPRDGYKSENVLDKWVLARLHALIHEVTGSLNDYNVGKAAGLIESFADDMSRWYIRRSRDRFQSNARGGGDEQDFRAASATLHEVLLQLSKLLAPFAPFFADALYRSLGGKEQSVHLDEWPIGDATVANRDLIEDMAKVRDLAAKALALRAEAGIKVRQPLSAMYINDKKLLADDNLMAILKSEVNVKEVVIDTSKEVELDTTLTPALKEEGIVRELVRMVQGLRADAGYQMGDSIVLIFAGTQDFSDMVQRNSVTLKKAVNAKSIELTKTDKVDVQLQAKFENADLWVGVRKV